MSRGPAGTYGLSALLMSGVLLAGAVHPADALARTARAAVVPSTAVMVSGPNGAGATRSTSVLGAAWEADNTPIAYARLRLRNVLSGKIEATTTANELGQFAFNDVESGSYLVELVGANGKILTLGQRFSVAPGETVATFVRMGTKVPWFNGFFGNAASAVSSTAASTGITAVAPDAIPCVSNCR